MFISFWLSGTWISFSQVADLRVNGENFKGLEQECLGE